MSRLAAAGLLAAVLLPLGPRADGQAAASVAEVGWWTRRPGAQPRPGGMEIARAPDGDLSVGAVRVRVEVDVLTKALISLAEAGGVGQQAASLRACRVSPAWAPADPGDWEAAPQDDCASGQVVLERNDTHGRWTADVTTLLQGGPGDQAVAVLPADAAQGGAPLPAFQVEIGSVRLDSEGRIQPSTSSGGSGSGGSTGPGTTTFSFGEQTTPAARAPQASTFGPSTGPLPVAAEPVQAAPAQPSGSFPQRARGTAAAAGRSNRPWGRLLVFVPLSALAGLGVAYGRRVARERGWVTART